MRQAIHFITDTNLYIALGAMLFAGSGYWYFGLPANGALLAVVGGGTLFMYNFQRWAGDLDQGTRYRRAKQAFMALGMAVALGTGWMLGWATLAALLMAGLLSVAYAVPLFAVKAGTPAASLRKLPYLKTWVIVLAWLLTTVLAPWLDLRGMAAAPAVAGLLLFALQQGALVFALTAAFDIRDLPLDDPAQRTLPQQLGIEGTVKLSQKALGLSLVAAALLYLWGSAGVAQMLAHALVIVLAGVLNGKSHPGRPPLFFAFWVDGVLVLQGLLMWGLVLGAADL